MNSYFDTVRNIDNPSHIKSIQKAIIIIEFLAKKNAPVSLTEISKALDFPKSTVHGIISTLRDFNYIDQSEDTGRYLLGSRLFELGNIVSRRWDIQEIARPILKNLNNHIGDTIHLAVESRGEVLYLEKIESTDMLRIVSNVGGRLPMHCSGVGKVLLAYMPEAKVDSIIKKHGMKQFTSYTITKPEVLKKELKKIRERGYATDNNEVSDGLSCVAVPVFFPEDTADYAISASGLTSRMNGQRLETLLGFLYEAANKISHRLSYVSNYK